MKETVNIHGKEYETVASRVKRFREENPNHGIITELLYHDKDKCIVKASVVLSGEVIATGHAEEVRESSRINKTSAIENCETSAIGRALACFGYLGSEFASADEVANAITQHAQPKVTSKEHAQKNPEIDSIMSEAVSLLANQSEEIKAQFRAQYKGVKSVADAKAYLANVKKAVMVSGVFQDDELPPVEIF